MINDEQTTHYFSLNVLLTELKADKHKNGLAVWPAYIYNIRPNLYAHLITYTVGLPHCPEANSKVLFVQIGTEELQCPAQSPDINPH